MSDVNTRAPVASSAPDATAKAGKVKTRRQGQRRLQEKRLRPITVHVWQLFLLAAILAFWQYVPTIHAARSEVSALDPFFISSPSLIVKTLRELFTGHGEPSVWPYIWTTLKATILGCAIGIASGVAVGLLLSTDVRLRQVLNPFINALNAAPKIALIPIVIIILGPSGAASVVVSVMIVFFMVFFNAYMGGRSVPPEMLESARLMGSSSFAAMYQIRLRYVLVWTFASLPNAVTYALLGVITCEILGGGEGLGQLIVQAIGQVDASLTFAVVVLLSIMGVVLVSLTELLRGKALHWWPGGGVE
jgi:NitT/TauT family transport system permease protein